MRRYRQKATYWTDEISDGLGGWTYGNPEIIDCRWEIKGEEFIDKLGEVRLSNALVYVTQDLKVGDWLALGEHEDPIPAVSLAYRIKQFSKIPSLRDLKQLRIVYL